MVGRMAGGGGAQGVLDHARNLEPPATKIFSDAVPVRRCPPALQGYSDFNPADAIEAAE
jgi:hypothetical protein